MERAEAAPRPGFWRRQFGASVTTAQVVFDVCFGLLLPVACLRADPVVFRAVPRWGFGRPILADYAAWGYAAIALSLVALAAWLALRRFTLVLAGPLWAGALVAFVIGAVLLPLSLVTLVVGIGLLGLVPWATVFVYARNAVRAVRFSGRTGARIAVPVALGVVLALALPAIAHVHVHDAASGALARLLDDAGDDVAEPVETLRRYRHLVNLDEIVWAWHRAEDPARQDRLSRAYRAITGQDVDHRWVMLAD